MTPDPVVITGEICGTACFLTAVAALWSLFWKRLRVSKLSAAQQDADRKPPPPEDTEPEAVVPAATIVPGFDASGDKHVRAVGA